MRNIFVLSICLLIASCIFGQNPVAVKQAASACGNSNIYFEVHMHHKFKLAPPIEKDKARIYVIESYGGQPAPMYGGPIYRVGVDGHWVGAERAQSYLYFSVTPGKHHLCINWQSRLVGSNRLIWLNSVMAHAGQTYYFQAVPMQDYDSGTMGISQLGLLDSDEAQLLLAKYPLAVSNIEPADQ